MLSHIAEGEWRGQFMGNPLVAPKGFGAAETPWKAVQIATRAALTQSEPPSATLPMGHKT